MKSRISVSGEPAVRVAPSAPAAADIPCPGERPPGSRGQHRGRGPMPRSRSANRRACVDLPEPSYAFEADETPPVRPHPGHHPSPRAPRQGAGRRSWCINGHGRPWSARCPRSRLAPTASVASIGMRCSTASVRRRRGRTSISPQRVAFGDGGHDRAGIGDLGHHVGRGQGRQAAGSDPSAGASPTVVAAPHEHRRTGQFGARRPVTS